MLGKYGESKQQANEELCYADDQAEHFIVSCIAYWHGKVTSITNMHKVNRDIMHPLVVKTMPV